MDGSRFDDLARATATSRRGALKLLVAAATGFVGLSVTEVRSASLFHRAGKKCSHGQPCGSLAPCTGGVCTPTACLAGGLVYQNGDLDPDNTCRFCMPGVDTYTGFSGEVGDGSFCTAAAGPCTSESGQCLNAACVPDELPDGTSCGAGQICCSGGCCAAGKCCGTSGACEICFTGCEIEGTRYDSGDPNPQVDCLYCDPSVDPTAWTPVTDQTTCGGVPGRVCCNGECCSPTECCNGLACEECGPHCRFGGADIPAGTVNTGNDCLICDPDQNIFDWSPAADDSTCGDFLQVCCNAVCCDSELCCRDDRTCDTCPCEIGNDTWEDGDLNPANDCQICDSGRNPQDWPSTPNGSACGSSGDRECCDGACCPSGECCTLDGCGQCPCEINGQEYADGQPNYLNSCEICDVDFDRFNWTLIADGALCGDNDTQECCGGHCCPPGECCTGGQCEPCGCEINGEAIDPGTLNQANSCQVCDPVQNLHDWSPVAEGTACGASGSQRCCGGECCAEGDCCLLDACGTCLCQIEGATWADGAVNPNNICQVCDQETDPFDWTPVPNYSQCGTEQVCCGGECCRPGECCVAGLCAPCTCRIEGSEVAAGTINSANQCQLCDPVLDLIGWSSVADDTVCGATVNQLCCDGTCCTETQCCDLDRMCSPCACLIDGTLYPGGATSPDEPCLICEPLLDEQAFSPNTGNSCGDQPTQFCCEGTCCEPHACCDLSGACLPCRCIIGGVTYDAGVRNLARECEICDPFLDPAGWSLAPSDAACGVDNGQFCCQGVCCPDGECCHAQDGACGPGPCTCRIGEEDFDEGELNPANECQVCDPATSVIDWSPAPDQSVCGAAGSQICCDGVCCTEGQCCHPDGFCVACDCTINGAVYPNGSLNPLNGCEFCDPSLNESAWSVFEDGTSCGPNLTNECCAGECKPSCLPDGCIIDGVFYVHGQVNPDNYCEFCDVAVPLEWSPVRDNPECPPPCFIDGVWVPGGTVNPDNPCECCASHLSSETWSPCDWLLCGANEDQHCCNSVCCGVDECCGATSSACTLVGCPPEVCTISGVEYEHLQANPLNPCEYCDIALSATAWTPKSANSPCGSSGEQFCCNGQCCQLGICCNSSTLTCDPNQCKLCVIGGQVYSQGGRNPLNGCEWCNTFVSTTTWSYVNSNFYCDPGSRSGACCNGVCCPTGQFCNTLTFTCQS